MNRLRPYLAPIATIVVVVFVLMGISMLFGRRVSGVLSTVNYGLSPSGGGFAPPVGSAPHAPPQPGAHPPHAATSQPETAAQAGGQQPGLRAGEVDDNAQFAEYLRYLDDYQGNAAQRMNVSERYVITVLDGNQRPVLDARVRVYNEAQQVFEGRTYAGGQTLLLPRALGVGPAASVLRIVADAGNASSEATLTRGQQESVELTLPGAPQPAQLRLDVLFLLDTTGSMGDELARIQTTIDSIAARIDALDHRPELRFGLVAYRDRGDDYVVRTFDFTADVGAFRTQLAALTAAGGGDTPEALNEALHAAVANVGWADGAVRLVFLVADAPPHMDYPQDYNYLAEVRQAVAQGIKIYPIAASNTDQQAEYVFRQLAQQTLARFVFLTYQPGASGGAAGDSTTLNVGQQQYSVERLDDLIVQIVQRELAAAVGAE